MKFESQKNSKKIKLFDRIIIKKINYIYKMARREWKDSGNT